MPVGYADYVDLFRSDLLLTLGNSLGCFKVDDMAGNGKEERRTLGSLEFLRSTIDHGVRRRWLKTAEPFRF